MCIRDRDDVLLQFDLPVLGQIKINKLMLVVVSIISILILLGLMVTVFPGITNQSLWFYKP